MRPRAWPRPRRNKPLNWPRKSLTKFLADQPRHALAAEARLQLANVLFDRGRLQRMLAGQYEGQARQEHLEAARGLLQQADGQWAGIDKAADEELKQIVFVRGDEIKRSEARDRSTAGNCRPAWPGPGCSMKWDRPSPAGSGERTTALQDAGKRFDTLYDQQPDRLAGYYARLGRGLCCKDLGESEKAFAIFEELLDLPDDPADFHALARQGRRAGPGDVAAARGEEIQAGAGHRPAVDGGRSIRPAASAEVDLAIRFLGGEAALAYAKSLPAASPEQSELRTRQIDWARQQFKVVAAAAGPYQARPRSVCSIRRWALPRRANRGPLPTPACVPRRPWTVPRRPGRAEEGPAERRGQRSRFATPTAAADRHRRSEALKYCRLALDLRTAAERSAEDYDAVRYYLAYLHYASGELEEAAALGETVAQASSDSPAARQAAGIGLAAREALLRRATDASAAGARAAERLQALAENIIQRWGDRAEADDARGVLLDLALDEGQLPKAEDYLKEISAASPRRGEAELNLGRALWQRARHLLDSSTLEHDHAAEAEKTIPVRLACSATASRQQGGELGAGSREKDRAAPAAPRPLPAPRGPARPGPDPYYRGPACRGDHLARRPKRRCRETGFLRLPGPAGLCCNRPAGQGQDLLADTSNVAAARRRCRCRRGKHCRLACVSIGS